MAVSRAVKAGRLKDSVARDPEGRALGITDFALADREWAANTDYTDAPQLERKPTASAEPLTMGEAATAEKHWRAKLAELKFREAAGELLPRAEGKALLVTVFQTCRTKLLGVPSRVKQDLPHLTLADLATIEERIREALEELGQ